MKNNNVFLVIVMSLFLSACNFTNSINKDDTSTRHVSDGADDWTDTPADKTPPNLDGESVITETSSSCSQDKDYIYGTSQGCNFSLEELELGESQKLKCVGEDVYVNDILMSNPQIGNLKFTCQ